MLSRESLLLANNVTLTVAAMSVLIGTLYPLALDVLPARRFPSGRRTSRPCSCRSWCRRSSSWASGRWRAGSTRPLPELARRLRWALAASGGRRAPVALDAAGGQRWWTPLSTFALLLAAWAVASAAAHAWLRIRGASGGWLERLRAPARGLVGHDGRPRRCWRLHLRRDDGQRFRKPAGAHAASGRAGSRWPASSSDSKE
jgi:cytochrome c-type biogenesis protein CcmF